MGNTLDIRNALEGTLRGISGIPTQISYENVDFTPPNNEDWLRATLIPTITEKAARGFNAPKRYNGLFVIDVFTTKDKGAGYAQEIADIIEAAYPVGLFISENSHNIRIEASGSGQGVFDAPWFFVPVTIEWFSYI